MKDAPSRVPHERFSLVAGGPFHALLGRFGLIAPDLLPTRRSALVLALVAWLPPALLALLQPSFDESYSGLGYFTDWTVHTRFLIAIWMLVVTERYADGRFTLMTQEFRGANFLRAEDLPGFTRALSLADRRSGSRLAEGVLLAAALVWSGLSTSYTIELAGSSWEGREADGEAVLSWAGEATRFLGNPLFLFLVLRWLWRFAVWTVLLFRISRMPLQLSPMHPDRSAGLGFLSIYPNVFTGVVFALSCVVAASILKDLALARHAADTAGWMVAGWIVICLLVFLGPLLVFVRPLYVARERALLDYGRLANQHHLEFHRRWIETNRHGGSLIGSSDPSSAADINAVVESVRKLRTMPIDRLTVIQLIVAAGLPMLTVVGSQVPLKELAERLAGSLL